MKQLLVFVRKEFYHVFRDRRTLLIMFGMPFMQILLFGFALTTEVKNIDITIVDNAADEHSQKIISSINASPYFNVSERQIPFSALEAEFKKNKAKAMLIFPANFGKDLIASHSAQVQVITDGAEPNIAKTVDQYLSAIIAGYQQQLNATSKLPMFINTEVRMLYNEEGNGSLNFVPGVMALVLMIICTALTSVAVVREKELGTMEILLVSPFKPLMVLVAKAIPYIILSLANFTFILLLSVYVMKVPVAGNLILLYFESLLFIVASLSFGLMISTITDSQQVALLISMMGMLLPTIIFTGFIFPIENMPLPLQVISNIVPAKWYYIIVKSIMIKGLPIHYYWKETLILSGMALFLLTMSIRRFKIRLS